MIEEHFMSVFYVPEPTNIDKSEVQIHTINKSEACILKVDQSAALMSGFQETHGYLCWR